jgi:hypothetical protein
MSDTVYFQPKGINPKYCEAGMILKSDQDYIHYYDEPCKILISEVKIIQKRGQIWYNRGETTAADGKGLGKSNTAQAKFIAGEPTNVPE